jgi:polyisoprenoid-binding protein YceI
MRGLLLLSALIVSAACLAADPEPTSYKIDPVHTQVFFSLSHLGFSHPTGRFKVAEGSFRFDPEHWEKSSCAVKIAVDTLNFGDAAWEKKVLSDEFFDVKRHPTMDYQCESMEKTGDNTGRIRGKLALRGVTRDVTLEVHLNKVGTHSFTLQHLAGFSATGTLKRSDFGIKTLLPGVGDEVELRLEVEGSRS